MLLCSEYIEGRKLTMLDGVSSGLGLCGWCSLKPFLVTMLIVPPREPLGSKAKILIINTVPNFRLVMWDATRLLPPKGYSICWVLIQS